MKLKLLRFAHGQGDTLGLLFINGVFECFTLEDEHRLQKVWGQTRIPDGDYPIQFRKEGGFHERYKRRYPQIHQGMLELQEVPNFKYILIHAGNTHNDTAGCLLVGRKCASNTNGEGYLEQSRKAYESLYIKVALALINEEKVNLTISNL